MQMSRNAWGNQMPSPTTSVAPIAQAPPTNSPASALPAGPPVTTLPAATETVSPPPAVPTAPPSTAAKGSTVVNEQGQRVSMSEWLAQAKDRQAATMGRAAPAPSMSPEDHQRLTQLRELRDNGMPQGISMRHSYAPGGGRTTTLTGANGAPLPPAQQAMMQTLIDSERSRGSNSVWGDPTLKLNTPKAAPQKLHQTEFTDADLPKLLPGFAPGERPDVVAPYLQNLQRLKNEHQGMVAAGDPNADAYLPDALRPQTARPALAQNTKSPGFLRRFFGNKQVKTAGWYGGVMLKKAEAPPLEMPKGPALQGLPAPTLPPKPVTPPATPAAPQAQGGGFMQQIGNVLGRINPDVNYAHGATAARGVSPPATAYDLDPKNPYNLANAVGSQYNPARSTQLPSPYGPNNTYSVPNHLMQGAGGWFWQTALNKLSEMQGQQLPRGGSMFSAATAPARSGIWGGPPLQAAPGMYGNFVQQAQQNVPSDMALGLYNSLQGQMG